MHANSIEAYKNIDKKTLREKILKIYEMKYPCSLTDREVAFIIGAKDMNEVRPRISELKKSRKIEEVGKEIDYDTGKKVGNKILFVRNSQLDFFN